MFRPQQQGQPQQPQQAQPQPQTPQLPEANVREFKRPTPMFTAGSQLVLDGQEFGGTPGRVQLIVGAMRLPARIANWTPNEVAIALPQLDLTSTSDARIVIFNANGQMVTSSNIRLAPAASRLAMGN